MLQIFQNTNFDFMGRRRMAYIFSALMILLSTVSLFINHPPGYVFGPRFGIDFTGGLMMQVRFDQPAAMDKVRGALDDAGLKGAEIQSVAGNNDIMIRFQEPEGAGDPFPRISAALGKDFPGNKVTLMRQENVGPKIGKELAGKAMNAIFGALGMILLYIALRYEWKFALGAVLALAHDVYITLGFLSLFHKEFTLTVMAALMTIAGYSNNDTIVVFDRIRERAKVLKRDSMIKVINLSVNETLSRTIITSLTVTLSVLALYLFGGEVIHDFAFAMLVGVVFGTYSSVYVASALALDISLSRMKESPAPVSHKKASARG